MLILNLDDWSWVDKEADDQGDDPPFVVDEESYSKVLQDQADKQADIGLAIFALALANAELVTVTQVMNALDKMSNTMDQVQTRSVNAHLENVMETTIVRGAKQVGAGDAIQFATMKNTIKEKIVSSTAYYSNKFFNTQVVPNIEKLAKKVIEDQKTTSRAAYDILRNKVSEHYKSVPYWDLVANGAVSRGYHYGLVKGGWYAGYKRVRFNAVMDSRTSAICESMNGSTWSIESALNAVEKRAMAAPEDMKNVAPWLTEDEFIEMSDRDLEQAGVIVPPLHARCRSTLEMSN